MRVIGIDPGTFKSAYVVLARSSDLEPSRTVLQESAEVDNEQLLLKLRRYQIGAEQNPGFFAGRTFMAIENIEGMGMMVGRTTFDTCIWIGKFVEAWENNTRQLAHLVSRGDERIVLCGCSTYINPVTGKRQKISDAAIRASLIERFEPTGGGRIPQIGVKSKPGPLYGVSGHAWQALSVAMTFMETHDGNGAVIAAARAKGRKRAASVIEENDDESLGI